MNRSELREELEKITSESDASSHKRKIETLSKDFDCSIRVLPEYDQTKREIFNCFEYALGLYPNVHQAIRLNVQDLVRLNTNDNDPDENFWSQFLEYLVEKGDIHKKEKLVLSNNDLVIYFRNSKPKHAGLWKIGILLYKPQLMLEYCWDLCSLPCSRQIFVPTSLRTFLYNFRLVFGLQMEINGTSQVLLPVLP